MLVGASDQYNFPYAPICGGEGLHRGSSIDIEEFLFDRELSHFEDLGHLNAKHLASLGIWALR